MQLKRSRRGVVFGLLILTLVCVACTASTTHATRSTSAANAKGAHSPPLSGVIVGTAARPFHLPGTHPARTVTVTLTGPHGMRQTRRLEAPFHFRFVAAPGAYVVSERCAASQRLHVQRGQTVRMELPLICR